MATASKPMRAAISMNELFKIANEKMEAIGRPSLKDENFKFTPIRGVKVEASSSKEGQFSENQASEYLPQEQALSCIYSGGEIKVDSSETMLKLEAWSESAAKAVSAEELYDLIYPSKVFERDYFAWAAINHSFSGFSLRIPKGSKVSMPFHLFLNLVGEDSTHRLRTRIHLEEDSELNLFAGAYSNEKVNLFHLQTFVLDKAAKLNFCDFQSLSDDSQYFLRQDFSLGEGARVSAHWATKSSGVGQIRVHIDNQGEGSCFQGRLSLSIAGQQYSDFWIENLHSSKHSTSSMEQWAVLDDKAKSVFNGLIRILPKMNQSDALHKSRSLVLSDRASSENMPKLIIETDDVKVSHGASISNLDLEQLYYLESRGIEKEEAKNLMISGFLRSSWDNLETQAWKDFLEREFYSS